MGGTGQQAHRRTKFQCGEVIKATCREELSPAGNLLVMEEGFTSVVFQQTFIEQPFTPGPGTDIVPALTGLDPGRGPVEKRGVGGWGCRRYKEQKLPFLQQRPRYVRSGGLNLPCPLG